jgi:stress-induced-phosphoprotein 1
MTLDRFSGLEFEPNNQVLLQGQQQVKEALMMQFLNSQQMDTEPSFTPKETPKQKEPSPPPSKRPATTSAAAGEDENLPENKKRAKRAKEEGNAAYKKKDFASALNHYNQAIEHDPTDITFYNNMAAVYFEQKDYRKAISQCEKGIEVGRENRADYKLIAKSFARIGNSYRKLGESRQAKTYFEKSLSEHRTPEVKTLLSEVEAVIKEEERRAFIDPEKAEEEKEKGNEFFKKGDFSNAIKHYTEAINRNPDDPKLYSNRAACYTKLAAFDLGLRDCDMCTKLDEKFIKGWIRKGKILQGMQQPSKALAAYQKALEIDATNSEALEGYRACTMAVHSNPEEVRKKAMNDPEVQSILKDPAMRMILEQMQSDPKAVQE